MEYFHSQPYHLVGQRGEVWQVIARIVEQARARAVGAARLRETANDRQAVATVVTKVGEAKKEDLPVRAAGSGRRFGLPVRAAGSGRPGCRPGVRCGRSG